MKEIHITVLHLLRLINPEVDRLCDDFEQTLRAVLGIAMEDPEFKQYTRRGIYVTGIGIFLTSVLNRQGIKGDEANSRAQAALYELGLVANRVPDYLREKEKKT
jgi:hypothetical protein